MKTTYGPAFTLGKSFIFKSSIQTNLKGQCHEIFDHFFGLKDSMWAPYGQAKTVSLTFLFLQRYSNAKFENCMAA